ncbi:MAG: hypothetical protein U0792_09015 [Gemmataceae bacterium]
MSNPRLDIFEYDDGVIDDDVGEHEPEERELFANPAMAMIAKVPVRDTDVDHRQNHCPPVLKEQQHHDGDEDDRIAKRVEHLDGLLDERRGIVTNGV